MELFFYFLMFALFVWVEVDLLKMGSDYLLKRMPDFVRWLFRNSTRETAVPEIPRSGRPLERYAERLGFGRVNRNALKEGYVVSRAEWGLCFRLRSVDGLMDGSERVLSHVTVLSLQTHSRSQRFEPFLLRFCGKGTVGDDARECGAGGSRGGGTQMVEGYEFSMRGDSTAEHSAGLGQRISREIGDFLTSSEGVKAGWVIGGADDFLEAHHFSEWGPDEESFRRDFCDAAWMLWTLVRGRTTAHEDLAAWRRSPHWSVRELMNALSIARLEGGRMPEPPQANRVEEWWDERTKRQMEVASGEFRGEVTDPIGTEQGLGGVVSGRVLLTRAMFEMSLKDCYPSQMEMLCGALSEDAQRQQIDALFREYISTGKFPEM